MGEPCCPVFHRCPLAVSARTAKPSPASASISGPGCMLPHPGVPCTRSSGQSGSSHALFLWLPSHTLPPSFIRAQLMGTLYSCPPN